MLKGVKNKHFFFRFLVIAAGAIFLVWRAPYGYSFNDEPFIVTLGQRLSYGDAMIIDEWHLSQMIAPVILLFYNGFHFFCASNDGILLCFRYLYCLIWFFTCWFVCSIFKQKYEYVSLVIFGYLVLFAPFDLMTLSYKSFGLIFGLLLSAFLYYCTLYYVNNAVMISVITALVCFFSMACPYMGVFFVFSSGCIYVYNARCSKTGKAKLWNNRAILTSIILYGITMFVILYFNSISKYGIQGFFNSLGKLFEDPEHDMLSLGKAKYCLSLLDQLSHKSKSYSVIIALCTVLAICKKKTHKYRLWVFGLLCAGYVCALISFIKGGLNNTFNYEVIDIALLGLVCFLLLDHKPWRVFFTFTCIGTAYILADGVLSSNTGLYEIGMNILIVGVSSIIYIVELCEEIYITPQKKKYVVLFCGLIFTLQLSVQFYTRMERQFYDSAPFLLTETIDKGASKGLKTTREKKRQYEANYDNLMNLFEIAGISNNSIFLSVSADPVLYLNAEKKLGTFSAWTFGYQKEQLYRRLLDYYNVNKSKIPDVIFAECEKDIIPELVTGYKEYISNGSYLFVKK